MVGNTIGNYKILGQIGEGGMGAVYRGVDLMLEREVAIKALRPELARQPNIVQRFRAEAVTLAKLYHSKNAPAITGVGERVIRRPVRASMKRETLDSCGIRSAPIRR